MKILRNLCLFISILAFMSLCVDAKASHAATFYVATTGSDGNPGTANAPFRTVQRGINRLSGGDTLVVKGGTYAEGNLAPPSGSSGAPTIIQAAPGEKVILQPNNRGIDTVILFVAGRSWITVDGLVLDGGSPSGERLTRYPVATQGQNSHLTLKNSEVKNGRGSCLLVSGSNWEIRNNHIHHCGTDTTYDHGIYFSGDHSLIVGNRFDHNAYYNIQNYGGSNPTDNTYDSNIFTASGCGVTLPYGSNHRFINNVMYNDALQGDRGREGLLGFGSNTKVYNNTLYNNGMITINNGNDRGAQIRNNILCNGRIESVNAALSNNLTSCPSFVNPGAGDFRLASGSAAIDAGMQLGEVVYDRDGRARPQGAGYDIGVYEFGSGATPPPVPAPRNLRLLSQP